MDSTKMTLAQMAWHRAKGELTSIQYCLSEKDFEKFTKVLEPFITEVEGNSAWL